MNPIPEQYEEWYEEYEEFLFAGGDPDSFEWQDV
tara:strand:- start:55 stop:156 length:102 start_codon:yes stop_codon:yes gene_type:complete